MNAQEDQEFERYLRDKAAEAKRDLGFPATLFLRMLGAEGGYATAMKLLSAKHPSAGFGDLVMLGRPDLTVEALVVESKWRTMFDSLLVKKAEDLLRKSNYAFTPFSGSAQISQATPTVEANSPITATPERALPLASPDAIAATEWLKSAYGAVLTFESRKEGHQQGDVPLRIYTVPTSGAQVAIRMNKGSPAIYVRKLSVDGRDIEAELARHTPVTKTYTGLESYQAPSSILAHAPFLRPSPDNVLLRFNPPPGFYKVIFQAALGNPNSQGETSAGAMTRRPMIDQDTLLRQLERNSETGIRGEIEALEFEKRRLSSLSPPCPDPDTYAVRISSDDVAAGYDIVSTWPGEERFIEVKATTSAGTDFFMSENERQTLAALGMKAWVYRVTLSEGEAAHLLEYQDPAEYFSKSMSTSVWRVRVP